jgi:RNA polymerase sigma-70 factor (ECF subfamily)
MLGAPMTPRIPLAAVDDVFSPDDGATVAELYDAHHHVVRSFARRLLGDSVTAEDLVHDVFVAVPAAMRRHRGEASVRTFLLSIAVNVAKKHVRAAARRRTAHERAALVTANAPATPEDDAARRELADALHHALDALPLDQRVAFVLLEIEERASSEAARIAQAPEATMRTRLFHAKRRLREILRKRGIA